MPWGLAVVAGLGVASSMSQAEDAEDAAYAQQQSAQQGINEERRQFDAIQKLLKPYVDAGQPALTGQQDLLGLNGQGAQRAAIGGLESSPMFAALRSQGENSILANASATGGLRGGNVQGALAQFSPQLLNQLIESQYSKLGGLTSLGQNSAVMQANAGQTSTGNIVSLLQQQGAAIAGGHLAEGKGDAGALNAVAGGFGMYGAGGGFGAGTSQYFKGRF